MRSWLCLLVLVLITTVQSSVPRDALRPGHDNERRSYLSALANSLASFPWAGTTFITTEEG